MFARFRLYFIVTILAIVTGASCMNSAFAQDSSGGSIAFSASSFTAPQSSGSLTITVDRTGGSSGKSSVQYHTKYGTALDGIHYLNSYGVLTWSNGDTTPKTFSIPILDRSVLTSDRSLSVSLTNPTNSSLGTPAEATATILPNQTGAGENGTSTVEFSSPAYSVAENAGAVTVTVNRTNGANSASSVRFRTKYGSALDGIAYSNAGGTLNWLNGDTTPKSFTVSILNKSPLLKSLSFTVQLFDPNGATVGTTGTAAITILPSTGTGAPPSGGTGNGPSAVTNLTLLSQGGPNNNIDLNQDSVTNSQTIKWTPATTGAYPIAYYQIYRNGAAYARSSTTTYTDVNATDSNDVQQNDGSGAFGSPRIVYTYNVSAVDSQGNVGPQAAQMTFWQHSDGIDSWGEEAFNPPAPAVVMNWASTAVAHGTSPSTISIKTNQSSQYIQPYSAPSGVPLYSFELGAFAKGYIQFDVYPTKAGQQFNMGFISRVTVGDLYNNAEVSGIGSNPAYGPVPLVQNAWNHIKVPIGAGTTSAPGLQMGFATFQGYISGKILTVTSISGQINLNASMWVRAPGMTTDYILGPSPSDPGSTATGRGGLGTYDMNVSQSVGSAAAPVTFTGQRTNLYKWNLQDANESGPNLWYLDNIGYTTN